MTFSIDVVFPFSYYPQQHIYGIISNEHSNWFEDQKQV